MRRAAIKFYDPFKVCPRCNEEKLIAEFGQSGYCKPCRVQYVRDRRALQPKKKRGRPSGSVGRRRQSSPAMYSESLLRLPAVKARVGLGKTEIYRRARSGDFPLPLKLNPRLTVWIESEIDAWIAGKIAGRGAL